MFAEMDSFAKAVLTYCSKNLAARMDSGTATTAATPTTAAAAAAAAVEGGEGKGPAPVVADGIGQSSRGRAEAGLVPGGAAAGGAGGRRRDGGNDGGPSLGGIGGAAAARQRTRQRTRPEEEELCAVVAEQWRLTAATLTRSRCVKGNGDAEARERREVRTYVRSSGGGGDI